MFWIHLSFVVFSYTSPLWLDWKWIMLGIATMPLQRFFAGGCIFTKIEFGNSGHNSFNWYYLNRLGFHVSLKTVKLFTDYLIPAALLIFALIWQKLI